MEDISRRELLKYGMVAAAGLALPLPKVAFAAAPVKELAFYNLHTDEKIHVAFKENGRYVPEAIRELSYLLRDYRNNKAHIMDPALFDQLYALQRMVETPGAFHVVSGYRSPETNATLHAHSNGVAKNSLHLQGRAIDIRLPGKDIVHLHKAALDLRAGGVGFYPTSDFIHLDTGRVRHWG